MSEKTYTPLPPASPVHQEDPRAKITNAEQAMYDEVLKHFSDENYELPGAEKGLLTDDEKFWLSRECLLRYLRASKWKTAAAIQRLEATLTWRRDFGLYDKVNAPHVEPEAVTGKEILFGYDVVGRPAFYMIPSRQNTTEATRQIEFAVWMLERGVDVMEPGVETLSILINFADKAKNPSLSTARTVLNILQDHYPERLGNAIVINVPFLVNAFFKIIMPFVDPVTREKVKFNPDVVKDGIFAPEMLMSQWWGGNQNFEYVHEKYWPVLVKTCDERHNRWKDSWKKLGGIVGVSEWEYKRLEKNEEIESSEEDKTSEKVEVPEHKELIVPLVPLITKESLLVTDSTAEPIPEMKKDDTKPSVPLIPLLAKEDTPAPTSNTDVKGGAAHPSAVVATPAGAAVDSTADAGASSGCGAGGDGGGGD
ncbi:CRAL/TRIO domain-containing protein [Crucibulum laeve]|uniref:CRAL/TRIO domain-containing protein n=1 Tax=Crucibulum laeve TaxID=68775 RepID=A0A5C3M4U6_9AGAR|nr:CRAL/TRIO domain-containing protein [Crucibulum laeve]